MVLLPSNVKDRMVEHLDRLKAYKEVRHKDCSNLQANDKANWFSGEEQELYWVDRINVLSVWDMATTPETVRLPATPKVKVEEREASVVKLGREDRSPPANVARRRGALKRSASDYILN